MLLSCYYDAGVDDDEDDHHDEQEDDDDDDGDEHLEGLVEAEKLDQPDLGEEDSSTQSQERPVSSIWDRF